MNSSCSLVCTLALAAASYGSAAHADTSHPQWQRMARSALVEKLDGARPAVAHWKIVPLLGKLQQQRLQNVPATKAVVTHLGSRSSVRLTWASEQALPPITVWFAVQGNQSLLTVKSAIRAGSAMTAEVAVESESDVMALACTPVRMAHSLAGMRAKRALRAGDVLCEESIEPRPAVARGQGVVVRSTAGAVTITTKGIAQQDGSLGAVLRIKNPATGDTYLATVTGRDEVVVHE